EELQRLNQKLEAMSITDEMTGLSNFRHFKQEHQREFERCSRYTLPYSLIFCDMDHFKNYNDRNGHAAGDRLLADLARVLIDCSRKIDLAARYGGEEFVLLCPNTTPEGAWIVAERIRQSVLVHPFPYGEGQPLGK